MSDLPLYSLEIPLYAQPRRLGSEVLKPAPVENEVKNIEIKAIDGQGRHRIVVGQDVRRDEKGVKEDHLLLELGFEV